MGPLYSEYKFFIKCVTNIQVVVFFFFTLLMLKLSFKQYKLFILMRSTYHCFFVVVVMDWTFCAQFKKSLFTTKS